MNLFVLASPLQVLNALEAREAFGLDGTRCAGLIIQSHSEKNNLQTNLMLRDAEWQALFYVPHYGGGVFNARRRFDEVTNIANGLGTPERVFLGDYKAGLFRHCANLLGARSVVLLDDGTGCLNVQHTRVEPGGGGISIWFRELRQTAIRLFMNIQLQPVHSVSYFTAYTLARERNAVVVRNDYGRLRSRSRDAVRTDGIYFIGSNLAELGAMSPKTYEALLVRAKEYFRDEKFIYFPHRLEEENKLAEIHSHLGFEIRHISSPLEAYLATSLQLPKAIAGFYSSAFVGCEILLGGTVDLLSFRISSRELRRDFRSGADMVYRYFGQHCPHITII